MIEESFYENEYTCICYTAQQVVINSDVFMVVSILVFTCASIILVGFHFSLLHAFALHQGYF